MSLVSVAFLYASADATMKMMNDITVKKNATNARNPLNPRSEIRSNKSKPNAAVMITHKMRTPSKMRKFLVATVMAIAMAATTIAATSNHCRFASAPTLELKLTKIRSHARTKSSTKKAIARITMTERADFNI